MMGGNMLMQAHRTGIRLGLKPNERLVLCEIAATAKDTDPTPLYWASRERLTADTKLSGTRVKVAIQGLLQAGALRQVQKGAPGHNASFTPLFTAEENTAAAAEYRENKEQGPESGPHSVRKADPIRSGKRTPEDSSRGFQSRTPKDTGRVASDPTRVSPSQLSKYADYYVLAYLEKPTAGHVRRVLEATPEQVEAWTRKLWDEAMGEYRIDSDVCDYEAQRDYLQDNGALELLSEEGRAKLDARVTKQHAFDQSITEAMSAAVTRVASWEQEPNPFAESSTPAVAPADPYGGIDIFTMKGIPE